MKIKDYETVPNAEKDDLLLLDTEFGVKTIKMEKLIDSIDNTRNTITRRNTWRGKNLGSSVTYDQYTAIADGSFKGLFLGDYWEINNIVWRIVDFDYWYGSGDVSCTSHHVVIIPDHVLYEAKMNDTDTTEGGYVGSKMYTTGLNQAKSIINQAFGAEHILNHREFLHNASTEQYRVTGIWCDSTVELPNEVMMYGYNALSYRFLDGYTIDKTQLAGMMKSSMLINPSRENQWLRDPVSAFRFAIVEYNGCMNGKTAEMSLGVRPVFGITGV